MVKRLFILLIALTSFTIFQEKINSRILVTLDTSSCANSPECIVLTGDRSGISFPVNFVLKNHNQLKFMTMRNDEKESTESKKMLINLYTSMTMLALNCQAFSPYDCQRYSCGEYPSNTRKILHPYFIARGYHVETNLYSANWKLNGKAERILSTSCFAGSFGSYGTGTYGALGFGLSGASWMNFMRIDPIFSIYLYQDNSGGELWFSRNLNKTISKSPSAALAANNSWHVENIQAVGIGNKIIQLNDTKLIFDINAEEIGLSLKGYKAVMKALTKGEILIRCDDYKTIFYRPNCTYHGELKDLPDIIIYVRDQEVRIPPSVYVLNPESFDSSKGKLTLNLKGNYNVTHIPEIYVITEYKNHIILGRCFMRYYYIVFDGADHTENKTLIELYIANAYIPDDSFGDVHSWIIISAVVLFIIIIIGIIYLSWRKNRRRSEVGQHQKSRVESHNQELEVSQLNNSDQSLNTFQKDGVGFGSPVPLLSEGD